MFRQLGSIVVAVLGMLSANAQSANLQTPTVRWIDPAQIEKFAVESQDYACIVSTTQSRIERLSVGGTEWINSPGSWAVVDKHGTRVAPAPPDVIPKWETWQGQGYKPAKGSRARMNVWSAGPYYWDAHLLDIPLVSGSDRNAKPLRGEIVFHAQRDQLRIELKAEAAEEIEVTLPGLSGDLVQIGGRTAIVLSQGKARSAMLMPRGAEVELKSGLLRLPAKRATLVFRKIEPEEKLEDPFVNDLFPLQGLAFDLKDAAFKGYDDASGLYQLSTLQRREAFSFEESYHNLGRRIESAVAIRNDSHPREILLKTSTGVGNLEAAVIAVEAGLQLPIPVQVSKNFAGEMEEPDDKAFGDSYVPLALSNGESRRFRLLHLTHGYGLTPLKQVSSVRFFHIYWHLSTGASETTCFSMDWMEAGWKGAPEKTFFHIPDYRPMSGPFWPGQPQHHCSQFPGFLQYNNDTRLVYDYTTFDSISPLLSRFTMYFHTSDDAATARLRIMEIPQTDEMRTFINVRYDFNKPVSIKDDARENLRLVNIFEFQTPQRLLWTDESGRTRGEDVKVNYELTAQGAPLASDGPFLATHRTEKPKGDSDFQSLLLVRLFKARLGGSDVKRGAISARFNEKAGSYWLTTEAKSLKIEPGDFVEADIMLMPHGEPAPEWLKPERERLRFTGEQAPRVENVTIGTKLLDFPATIRADGNVAAFHLAGGANCLPVIIENFEPGALPLLWERGTWQNQQLNGLDDVQIESDGAGKNRVIYTRKIREGQVHDIVVTSVKSETGIASLTSENGRLVVNARKPGKIELEAPVAFGPGQSEFDATRRLFRFSGNTAQVREMPLQLSAGRIDVKKWNQDGGEVEVEGPGILSADAGWKITTDDSSKPISEVKIEAQKVTLKIRPEEP